MSQLTPLVSRQQLVGLLARERRYRAQGQPVPHRLQILIARVQNRVPDPIIDKRKSVDPRLATRANHPGTGGGKHVHLARAPVAATDKRHGQEFVAQTPKLSYLAGWTTYRGKEIPAAEPSRRILARRWARLVRPVGVRDEDWEMLRLTEVEQLSAPEVAAKLGLGSGSAVAGRVRKRVQRVRDRLDWAK